MLRSELPASGPFRLSIRVRDVQGAQQSGLPDRAKAEPGAARPEGKRPEFQATTHSSMEIGVQIRPTSGVKKASKTDPPYLTVESACFSVGKFDPLR